MARYLPLLILLLVTSCSVKLGFQPASDVLPDAEVGEYYAAKISAHYSDNARFYFTSNNTKIVVTPIATGLTITPGLTRKCAKDCRYYDDFTISGVPVRKGIIRINISVYTVSTMYESGKLISKEYLLTVK
jgi:hypothetical protein